MKTTEITSPDDPVAPSSSPSDDDDDDVDEGVVDAGPASSAEEDSNNCDGDNAAGYDDDDDDDDDGGDDDGEEDYDDDDSEYTYETVDDDDEAAAKNGGGWFGFLRRGRPPRDDDVEDYDDDEDDGRDGDGAVESEDEEKEDYEETRAIVEAGEAAVAGREEDEEDEAILMAEAIRRVQQRILSNGGKLYDALDPADRELVDSLNKKRGDGAMGATDEKEEEEVEVVEEAANQRTELPTKTSGADDAAAATILAGEPPSTSCPPPDSKVTLSNDPPPLLDADEEADVDASCRSRGRDTEEDRDETDDDEDEDDDDDDDDERPTLEEQHKLLSLAAEHDRVDVIQALLQDCRDGSTSTYESLLAGSGGIGIPRRDDVVVDNDDGDVVNAQREPSSPSTFVPPPLHVAVAHGSVNAASCLLRWGADPSLRPRVATAASISQRDGRYNGGSRMEEDDRNYKKYDGMSAWELAFGGSATTVDDDAAAAATVDDDNNDDKKIVHEEEAPAVSRGWFGFGSAAAGNSGGPAATLASDEGKRTAKTSWKKTKAKQPLNIPPAKLDGIRNAFIAEALRAIGSDEVRRLAQLLNAGMDRNTEVMAGKTLLDWAGDMDARDCREFLSTLRSSEGNGGEIAIKKIEECNISARQSPVVHDARLSGLTLGDIHMLVYENLNLIPHLTACRDDLAMETSICQSILSGGGSLSSHSLLELVRALKDQRARAKDSCAAWHAAWEEREDELDFFWEEVLDDGLREELGEILDQVQEEEGGMMSSSIVNDPQQNKDDDATMDERRVAIDNFIDAESRVKALRASIASLAEESAKYIVEIERHGMSGALSLTKSLRGEVKEWEEKMHLARVGEGLCRRKIDIIKQRIDCRDNSLLDEEEGDEEASSHGDEKKTTMLMSSPICGGGGAEGEDDGIIIEDYQLRVIVQQNQQQEANQENSRHLATTPYTDEVNTIDIDKNTDKTFGETNESIAEGNDEKIIELNVYEEDDRVSSHVMHEPMDKHFTKVRDDTESVNNLNPTSRTSVPSSGVSDGRTSNEESRKAIANVEPSHAIAMGMSTAIVVHSSSLRSSFSSQIWEILKRIVGLSRAQVTNRSSSNNNLESNPHIMTV